MRSVPRIVVVGGGAGGLELVTRLGHTLGKKKRAHITLVDAELTHVWKPLFHEVAVGTLDAHNHSLNYISHAQSNHYHFQFGRMVKLNRLKKSITLEAVKNDAGECWLAEREVNYDYLVMAVGSVANTYNIPGAEEHCAFLDSREESELFHQNFVHQVIRLRQMQSQEPLCVSIIGGGASGVELAAELRTAFNNMRQSGVIPHDQPKPVIRILEAGERILGMLPDRLSKQVQQELDKLDIQVLTQQRVSRIDKRAIHTHSGQSLTSHIHMWVAGIKAPDWLSTLDGIDTNARHQIQVKATLQSVNDDNIFALGDCAECILNDKPVPARAQSAHQQASHLIGSFRALLKQKTIKPYRYVDYGSLVNLSGANSQGLIMSGFIRTLSIEGKLAAIMYWGLYQAHQLSVHGFWRGLRLILLGSLHHSAKPRLKLH